MSKQLRYKFSAIELLLKWFSTILPLGSEVEHQPAWVLRRSSKSFPKVDISLAQTLWTQTPHGRCSTVGWTVLLDRSTAAICATDIRPRNDSGGSARCPRDRRPVLLVSRLSANAESSSALDSWMP